MRVAVVQFEVTDDVDANLQTCLRMIDKAQADCDPDLIVLPEYCNHPPLWRDDAHCYAVSLAPDGPFMRTIADKAKALKCMIQVSATMQHGKDKVLNTNTMFGPEGQKMGQSSKSFLISGENFFLHCGHSRCASRCVPIRCIRPHGGGLKRQGHDNGTLGNCRPVLLQASANLP